MSGSSSRRPPEAGAAHVLVVEDDADLRELMHLLLEQEGLRVSTVATGDAVVDACREHLPDAVVLDLTLPGMHGLEVCRALRADEELVDVPILLVTGFGRETGIDDALAAGADTFLIKPFRPVDLITSVNGLLRRSEGASA